MRLSYLNYLIWSKGNQLEILLIVRAWVHSQKSRGRNSFKTQLLYINRKNHWGFPSFIFIPPWISVSLCIFANKFSLLLHPLGEIWRLLHVVDWAVFEVWVALEKMTCFSVAQESTSHQRWLGVRVTEHWFLGPWTIMRKGCKLGHTTR